MSNVVDIMDIKPQLASGRFAVKINTLGSILLEDTLTCEAIQLTRLPEGYSFHEKGTWEQEFIYTGKDYDYPLEGHFEWACSVCGYTTDEKHDWCVCGADMRESNRLSREFHKLVEAL